MGVEAANLGLEKSTVSVIQKKSPGSIGSSPKAVHEHRTSEGGGEGKLEDLVSSRYFSPTDTQGQYISSRKISA